MRRAVFVVVAFFAVLALAQTKSVAKPATARTTTDTLPPSKARIDFDTREFDFGFAPQGNAYLVHIFTVKSVGEDTLKIVRVRPTCGCTAAPLAKRKLAPGESTELTAIFRTRGYRRAVRKSIKVESNDPTHRIVSLRFSANLDTAAWHDASAGPRIIALPEIVDLGKGDLFRTESEFKVKNISDQKLKLRVIDYTWTVLQKPEIKRETLKKGKSTKVKVKLVEGYDSRKPVKASITLAAFDKSDSEVCRITVPIVGGGK